MLILTLTETVLVKENIVSVTIRDVAQFCGVSVSTVSRVLNGYTDISEETANKVFDAIKKLDFVPSNTARMLSKKTKNFQRKSESRKLLEKVKFA